jgi:hypothetical protein
MVAVTIDSVDGVEIGHLLHRVCEPPPELMGERRVFLGFGMGDDPIEECLDHPVTGRETWRRPVPGEVLTPLVRRYSVVIDDDVRQPPLPERPARPRLAEGGSLVEQRKDELQPNRVVPCRVVLPGRLLRDQLLVQCGAVGIGEWEDHHVERIEKDSPIRIVEQPLGEEEGSCRARDLVGVV